MTLKNFNEKYEYKSDKDKFEDAKYKNNTK